jgi:hypothetical protein
MGTKNNPGKFDCYANALPDEPMFIVLARDPEFADLVRRWGRRRRNQIDSGERPETDSAMVDEAYKCATEGARWRRENMGKWRKPAEQSP